MNLDGRLGSLLETGSLNHDPKAMYASQAYASTCHLWPLDKHSVWSVKTKRLRLQTTCSRLEAAVKPCISLYGLTALALVKGKGDVRKHVGVPLSGLLRLVLKERVFPWIPKMETKILE